MERPEGWVYRVGVNVLGRRRHRATRERQLLEQLEVAPVVVEPQIDPAVCGTPSGGYRSANGRRSRCATSST